MTQELYCLLERIDARSAKVGKKEQLIEQANRIPGSYVCRMVPFYSCQGGK